MKRTFLIIGVLAICLCLTAAVAQAQTIVGSRHDMSARVTGSNGAVCVYCHTPHGGDQTKGPLWNRIATSATYTVYTSSTLDMTPLATTAGVGSNLCMSCHDGSVAINVLVNAPTTQAGSYGSALTVQNYNAAGAAFATLSDPLDATELGFFGTDLTSQHPIGMSYDTSAGTGDTDFKAQATAEASGIVFYNTDKVECQSCHDVHEYTNIPFLRIDNDNSSLCTACHSK